MASYRNISVDFWTDDKIYDDFTPEDKYFYLYLLTNSHTNICGCYAVSDKQFEHELGYTMDTVRNLLKRFEEVHKVIKYNRETKEVLVLNWHKYNWSASPKALQAVKSVCQYIKCDAFREIVIAKMREKEASKAEKSAEKTAKFNQGTQHDYDFDEIERRALSG